MVTQNCGPNHTSRRLMGWWCSHAGNRFAPALECGSGARARYFRWSDQRRNLRRAFALSSRRASQWTNGRAARRNSRTRDSVNLDARTSALSCYASGMNTSSHNVRATDAPTSKVLKVEHGRSACYKRRYTYTRGGKNLHGTT